jgi:ribosome-associated protein
MIEVTTEIILNEDELAWEFVRASGPGGQKVNKVSTAVQLRFDVQGSPSIPEGIKERLIEIGGKRVTAEGILIINARRYRSQAKNRQDALERLIELLLNAVDIPQPRKATKPSQASKTRRREEKKRQSVKKRLRKKPELNE